MEYHILTEMDPDELAKSVNSYLEMGWILHGGVSVSHQFGGHFLHAQAMVKPDEE